MASQALSGTLVRSPKLRPGECKSSHLGLNPGSSPEVSLLVIVESQTSLVQLEWCGGLQPSLEMLPESHCWICGLWKGAQNPAV